MKTITPATPSNLNDVLYAFSISWAKRQRGGDLLDEFIKRFPEHAEELTSFAIELSFQEHQSPAAKDATVLQIDLDKRSPTVSRGMSRFQNRLHAVRTGAASPKEAGVLEQKAIVNPFSSFDRISFRQLANKLQCNTVFVTKLRDRLIDPRTISEGFFRKLSEVLDTSVDAVRNHLFAPLELQASGQLYKSDQKPQTIGQQPFEQAVRGSSLTPEQQDYLLRL